MNTSDLFLRIPKTGYSTLSAVTVASTPIVLSIADAGADPATTTRIRVVLRRVTILRTSATTAAATIRPRIDNASGQTANDTMYQEWLGSTGAAASLYNVDNIDVEMLTDASGRLYLTINPDAVGGAMVLPDDFSYVVWFKVVG
jgi:hypothetical protein